MNLRTDTLGHFANPREEDIRKAICYPGSIARTNDVVKLMVDDDNYLAVWIGKKQDGHRLVLRFGPTIVECSRRLDSDDAAALMIQYLLGDLSWFNEFTWDRPVVQSLLDNLQLFFNAGPERGP